jgi:hypothetical protein
LLAAMRSIFGSRLDARSKAKNEDKGESAFDLNGGGMG